MWKKSPVPFIKGKNPLIMAHRGDSASVPENTLEAYKEAYEIGVDVIETDLRMTKDEELIFFHDRTIDRTTDGKGAVISYTLEELKKFDQGYCFEGTEKNSYPFRGKGMQIQSLEEILEKFPTIKFNMDIKDKDARAAEVLARKLGELNAEYRVMVGSFHHKQLEIFRSLSAAPTSASPKEVFHFRTNVKRWIRKNKGLLFKPGLQLTQERVLGKAVPYFALQIPEKFLFLKLFNGPEFFTVSYLLNIAVHVWTINTAEKMVQLLDWGVDGIFSDKPSLLLEIIRSKFPIETIEG